MRLFTKTLILIIILFGVIATATSILSARNLATALTEEYESKGVAVAQGIADSSTEILLSRDLATVQAIIDQYSEIENVSYVFVADNAGSILAHNFVPGVPRQLGPLVRSATGEAIGSALRTTRVELPDQGSILHVRAPILAGVFGSVHVGMDLDYIEEHIWSTVAKQQLLMFAIFLVVVAIAYPLVNRIVKPISRLAEFTRSLQDNNFEADRDTTRAIERIWEGDSGEIGDLAGSFIAMEKTLQEYLHDLKETTSAKQRIESELNIAHEIQMSMIPKIFPPFPDRKEFDLHAKLITAREVGGDFYDFYFIDERRLCFAIGDVSGKGVPASLFMALTKTLFRASGSENISTAGEILAHLNREIARDNSSCMFVTAFCGILDTETGEVEYCNAGHNPPLAITGGDLNVVPQTGDVALGVLETAEYHSDTMTLAPGDLLVLYTDGITEAMDSGDQFFSESRLIDELNEVKDQSSRSVILEVLEGVHAFIDETPQSDDMTMLVLRYRGTQAAYVPTLSVRLKNQKTELPRFQRLMTAFGAEHGVPEETVYRVNLSLDEVLSNVLRYGYQDDEEHEISVVAIWLDQTIQIEVHDDGVAFNPLAVKTPDTGVSLEDREIGGLGIHIARTMMDDLTYRRELDANILTLTTKPRNS